MTGLAARILGILDRVKLALGFKGAVVVCDPEEVRYTAAYENPQSFPVAIPYAFVNGTAPVDDGTHTGASRSGSAKGVTSTIRGVIDCDM